MTLPPGRIDPHHHLRDLPRRPQPWTDGAWADPIRRTHALDDRTRRGSSPRSACCRAITWGRSSEPYRGPVLPCTPA
ncbi:hypothetical protein [Streptomyces paromomycinus]|uniref:Amidohydrolase n=1 Tax=Streptomyces paromomycinus TaxID=92743 RepID=A0A401WCF0_STREY|nr:hypothetical protein [Streptomyces paromomycinus]GCD47025.1 hypothetical protein GKJPGBOP_06782 [Streptomyces paromomycinus]